MSRNQKRYIIAIDTGGTFTDTVVTNVETSEVVTAKAPTTPHDFSVGVMGSIGEAAKIMNMSRTNLLRESLMLKHGTTVGTNAIITRQGSRVGFITTKGFEDTTLIGRALQRFEGLSDEEIARMPIVTKPEPIIQRSLIRGVYERIDSRGNVIVPLNIEDAKEQIRILIELKKVEAIGISFLFSFVNPIHEQKMEELIRQMYPDTGLFLALSHKLVPLVREYGRANTVILNCFIGNIMDKYLAGLSKKLLEEGFEGRFLVMQANGGTISWERVSPIRTLSSGPAGGVIGSNYLANLEGHKNVISTDMGGTSFDVSIIRGGEWGYEREPIISRWRIMLPVMKVQSIGAGGGTIARVDPIVSRLLVGPESAGSVPGPVCYDAGGNEPTVCDANLVLGALDPDYFLGGRMKLNKVKAERVIREKIAVPLKMDVVEAAAGIVTIVNAHMADSVRILVGREGLPPESFVIYAFGGTGPMHASYYAAKLGIKKIYVVPTSAVFCAFGIAGADIIKSSSFFLGYGMPVSPDILNSRIKETEDALSREMEVEGFSRRDIQFRHVFNMRYKRQVHFHSISLPSTEYKSEEGIARLIENWVDSFEKIYGKGIAYTRTGIELVSMDIDAIGKAVKPIPMQYPEGDTDSSAAFKGYREILYPEFTKDFVRSRIYEYSRLQPANIIEGPAIVESPISTTVILPGKLGRVDRSKNIIIDM